MRYTQREEGRDGGRGRVCGQGIGGICKTQKLSITEDGTDSVAKERPRSHKLLELNETVVVLVGNLDKLSRVVLQLLPLLVREPLCPVALVLSLLGHKELREDLVDLLLAQCAVPVKISHNEVAQNHRVRLVRRHEARAQKKLRPLHM